MQPSMNRILTTEYVFWELVIHFKCILAVEIGVVEDKTNAWLLS